MKHVAPIAILAALLLTTTGCWGNKDKKAAGAGDPTVADIRATGTPPAPPPMVQPIQPMQPVQPLISDSPPVVTQTSFNGASAPASGSYTIQKGDTLFKIARSRYGDASAVRKIKEANPGLDADHIRVGQKINLP
jgi:nucleoid-associated protein YgaU